MDKYDDIVARLRGFWQPNDTQSSLREEAADEIERLRQLLGNAEQLRVDRSEIDRLKRGGCARDQGATQFCAEAVTLQREIDRLRSELKAWQDAHRAHPDEFGGNPE